MSVSYQKSSEHAWWWKAALYLEAASMASINAAAHNLDDPDKILSFHEKIREAQGLLLDIFQAKGLAPVQRDSNQKEPLQDKGAESLKGPSCEGSPEEIASSEPLESS